MNVFARLPVEVDGKDGMGKALGLLVGVLGVLVAGAMLFMPVYWETAPGVAERLAGFEYLFGNATAEPIFHRATSVFLVSLFIIHVVRAGAVRLLWFITGIIGIAGIGGLRYGATSGKILVSAALLLAISAGFLTADRRLQ